jgi:hypothetical protein
MSLLNYLLQRFTSVLIPIPVEQGMANWAREIFQLIGLLLRGAVSNSDAIPFVGLLWTATYQRLDKRSKYRP